MSFVPRTLQSSLEKALRQSPVVYLNGPRQAGKSTLCHTFDKDFSYLTFDDLTIQSAANFDPISFIGDLIKPVIIDEVQIVPQVFRAIKQRVDELRRQRDANSYGQFLLTGSADIMVIPTLAESLVGRMQVLTLFPFSAAEAFGGNISFIPSLFLKAPTYRRIEAEHDLEEVIKRSTYPEISLNTAEDNYAWYKNYINTIIYRDVKAIADVEKISHLPGMLTMLASRMGGLLNHSEFSRVIGLVTITYQRYLTLFENVYLVKLVQPWFRNVTKRLVKTPKLYFIDTALAMNILGQTTLTDTPNKGAILENFVASEILKHLQCLNHYQLYHFRTSDGKEVDFVIEHANGQLIGIEVKFSKTVSPSDFKGLYTLQEIAGKDFIRGVVLYQGTDILPFGNNCYAVPLQCLWKYAED